MRADFPQFLRTASASLFPTEEGVGQEIFAADDRNVSDHDLDTAEARLGIQLPESYRFLLCTLGTGDWCGDHIPAPEALFVFPPRMWRLNGFVMLVDNVLGVGDRIAMNPSDPVVGGERPVYYCSHDPFGHTRVADSFEDWCRATSEAALNGSLYYAGFSEGIKQSWREYRKAHRWWKFW